MISSAIWDKSARVNFSKLIIRIQKFLRKVDDKQDLFGRLPFRIVVKTLRSCQAL